MRRLALATAVAGLSATGGAETPPPMRFTQLSVEQGLSQTTVLCIFQDRDGFIWLGTEDGLNRYDGNGFTVYKHDPADPSSLPYNGVWAIEQDPSGDLWIGTEGGGVARWSRAQDRFVQFFRHDPGDPEGLSGNRVRVLHLDRTGRLWVGTRDGGLDRIDLASGRIVRFHADPTTSGTLSQNSVYAIYEDSSGRIWAGTDGGLDRFLPDEDAFTHYGSDPDDRTTLSDNRVRAILEDRQGTLWVGTLRGLSRLTRTGTRFERIDPDPKNPQGFASDTIRTLLEDDRGRLWIGTRRGLHLYDPATEHLARYAKDPADPRSLGDNDVMSLFQDRGGVLWVGTRSGGVHRWNPATWSFGLHRGNSEDPSQIRGEPVQAFAEDPDGILWIGSLGGLDRLDRQTGQVRHFRAQSGKLALGDDRVVSLLRDKEGRLWIGTIDGGLHVLDERDGSLRNFKHDPDSPDSIGANGVMCLLQDSRGALWAGTQRGGLNRLDRATGRFTRFQRDDTRAQSLSSNVVTALAEDPAGSIWVGTEGGGLNLFDRESESFLRIRPDPDPGSGLGAETVFALHVDGSGTLWVGTRGGGLARLEHLDRATGQASFRRFSERNGLPNAVVYGILPDEEGRLWLSTNNGLSRFDPRDGSFRNFDVSHGLQGNEFNFGAHFRSSSGELFFGGPGGFNAFFPAKLERNTHAPPLVLTAFLKLNAPVALGTPVWALDRIGLAYNDDVVTFEFAALDYAAPERNRYSYKLEGFDSDWIDLGNVHRISYTDLDPGRYTLRVRAANNDGVASTQDLGLRIDVESPPWRTWWAYATYALILASVVLSIVRAQRQKAEREAAYTRRLEAEVEARTHELAERNTQLEEANAKLLETSLTDSLTGLRNRRFLFEEVAKDFALATRSVMGRSQPGEVVKLLFMMVDLDGFKPVNDTLGHAAGDRVLLQVRDLLQRACRGSDIIIRWGGDEFLIVGRSEHLTGVEVFPERVRRTIEEAVFDVGQGQSARLTCSIGFTSYPMGGADPQGLTLENMVILADRALYMAKRSGRNGWVGLLGTAQSSVGDVLRVIREGEAHPGGTIAIRSSETPPL